MHGGATQPHSSEWHCHSDHADCRVTMHVPRLNAHSHISFLLLLSLVISLRKNDFHLTLFNEYNPAPKSREYNWPMFISNVMTFL